jgi:hypothetical protein
MVVTTVDKAADVEATNKAAQVGVLEAKEVRREERENAKIKVESSPSFVRWRTRQIQDGQLIPSSVQC